MNLKPKQIFKGKVVNKAHTISTGVDEFPRYVLEYLIGFTRDRLATLQAKEPVGEKQKTVDEIKDSHRSN